MVALLVILITESETLCVLAILVNLACFIVYLIHQYTNRLFSNVINKISIFVVYFCSFAVLAVIPVDITETIWYAD